MIKTIRERLLIATLSISKWVAKKYDPKATKAVEQKFKTHGANIGQFQKELVDNEEIKAIEKIANRMRVFHNENTLPWGDNGERLIPVEHYMDYLKEMEKMKTEFDKEVKKFLKNYLNLKEKARVDLNGLFNEKDYPANIEDKFGVRVRFIPVPDTEDIRIDLPAEEVEKIQGDLVETVNSRLADAVGDIWTRLQSVLKRVTETLSGDKAFKNTIMTNITDLLKIVPKLNIYNDPKIDEICKEMKKVVVNPDNLRKDAKLKKKTCKTAQEVLDKMSAFMG